MMKLSYYWDEWYTVFAQLPRKIDLPNTKYIEVTDDFGKKYLAAYKEFVRLTKELKKKTGE